MLIEASIRPHKASIQHHKWLGPEYNSAMEATSRVFRRFVSKLRHELSS